VQAGDITVTSALAWSAATTLNLNAAPTTGTIAINAPININGNGGLNLTASALPRFGVAGMVAIAQTPKNAFVRDGQVLGSLLFQTNLSTLMLTDLAKNSLRRNRPLVYNSQAPLIDRMESDARKSFFSGHASMTACNTFFAAKIWTDMHPNSKLKPWVWTAAAAVPAYAALQRVQAGKHYPSDVIVGLAVGAAMGYLIPQIHLTR
jgi:membrane-associated phospholipid phosphatase